jgi:hypothetical protein
MAEWAGLVGKGLIDGGSVDVDFGDDALYSYCTQKPLQSSEAGPTLGFMGVAARP